MIKLIISNEYLFKKAYNIPLIRHLLSYDLRSIQRVNDSATYNLAYSTIAVKNKVSKTTTGDRFRDLNELSFKYLCNITQEIHDIGVSNGITSIELYNTLKSKNLDIALTVSDKYSRYTYYTNSPLVGFYTDRKIPDFMYFFNMLFSPEVGKLFFLSKILYYVFLPFARTSLTGKTELVLFDKKLVELINNKKVQNLYYDVFETRQDPQYTFVRCMNLLNINYFKNDKIFKALNNIHASLKEGGIFLVGTTDLNMKNNASFYIKKRGSFIWLEDIGEGCNIRDLIKSFSIISCS